MGKGGIGNMMKQVQQMQAKMEKIQAELEESEVEGTSGGGMVKVIANGSTCAFGNNFHLDTGVFIQFGQ